MTPKQRGEIVEKEKACWSCLDWRHEGKDCKAKKWKCQVQVGSNTFNGVHHRLLHDSGVAYCHLTKSKFGDSLTLFEIQYIWPESTNTPANTLFDNSSSASLITHTYAEQQGSSGEPISYWLMATGYQPQLRKTTL